MNNRPADLSRTSGVIHSLQTLSSKAAVSAVVAVVSFGVLLWAALSVHRDTILVWFGSVAAAITVVMVFVLQHTQNRQQEALQHKLDEVLHALPGADDRLINLESAPESTLLEVELRHTALRDDALDEANPDT